MVKWDLDTRKVGFENSDHWLKTQKTIYEQEMDNLKTILSENQQNTTGNKLLNKKYIALFVGIMSIVIIASTLVVLQFL